MTFKLTYSTMFDPPEELHERFGAALRDLRRSLGGAHQLYINGRDRSTAHTFEKRSPIDHREVLGTFSTAAAADVDDAVAGAKAAFPQWRATSAAERERILLRAAALLEERVYMIGAALALEVGKNRMEALGETQETADFFSSYTREFQRNGGYSIALPDDPLKDYRSHNRSVLKPHGVWGVIAPFNFPLALAGGPVAAALITGNTVVLKASMETPWSGRLLAECLRDAELPDGVFNYLVGSGSVVGEALVGHRDLAGITFTGSYGVGMRIYRRFASSGYPRPCIAEMGGKNACIVTGRADLDRAANGIVRSAYGLTGQKCSALSRVYVDAGVADDLIQRLVDKIAAIHVGDPTKRENWMGPVISEEAASTYSRYCNHLFASGGRLLAGGKRLTDGDLGHGWFVAPTLAEAPADHPLFAEEMFQPILMLARVRGLNDALALANDVPFALAAGCYGDDSETQEFLDRIEAGVTYVNRPQGATTGAWPGYQPFGGWKGSGTTGKAIGSRYYLPLYLREQSQTVVE